MKKTTAVTVTVLSVVLAAVLSLLGFWGWKWYDANVDRSGWVETDGRRYYKDFHGDPVTGWQEIDGSRYYFGADSTMATHWLDWNGKQYYLGDTGAMTTGWQEIQGSRYHFSADGILSTGWLRSNGQHYYLNEDGTLQTGWLDRNGLRYYMGDDGAMVTGWLNLEEKTYFLRKNGTLATGWVTLDGQHYFFAPDGSCLTGWQELDGKRYHFAEDGAMSTGWQELDGQHYFFNKNGTMHTGWLQQEEYRYYLTDDGTMAVSPTQIGEQTYYFTPEGIHVVLVNSTHPVPEDYALKLVTLDNGFQMDTRCVEALTKMLDDCVAAGRSYKFNSGYRGIYEQQFILDERTEEHMEQGYSYGEARYMALLTVAVPGTSEHHLGLAVDVEGIAALEWLSEHCWEYGFILRYPEGKTDITGILYEPWHFRYVGTKVSMAMKDTGLCLEEYLNAVE